MAMGKNLKASITGVVQEPREVQVTVAVARVVGT
jgi:hypothetical protein